MCIRDRGKDARSTTGILRPKTRVPRARCRDRRPLRRSPYPMMGTIADQGRPVPLMMPLRRGSPQNPLLGEASEPSVRPSVVCGCCITSSLYPGSIPPGRIYILQRLSLGGFNVHGVTAFWVSPTTCCSLPEGVQQPALCLLYTSPSPRDLSTSRMPSSA